MRLDCFEKSLKRFFGFYGTFLAKHAVFFVFIPLAISVGLGFGVMHLYIETNSEFLYTPSNGPAKEEKRIVNSVFVNHTCGGVPVSRRTCEVDNARIIVVSKTTGGILERERFEEILDIYYRIKDISISDGSRDFVFEDLCTKKMNGTCETVSLFELYNFDANNINTVNITYPFATGVNRKSYFIGNELSGIKRNGPYVEEASAIQLSFSLEKRLDGLSQDWLDKFLEECEKLESKSLDIYVYTSHALSLELSRASRDVIDQFAIAFTLLMGFSVLSCFRFDCVKNKPTLAVAGVLSACLAILSAFGLTSLCGVPYIDISSSAPYFIISIGVDDMFIMMAAWRKTNPRLPVEVRTSQTLSEAALSITITSLTDTLVFVVGALSPFPSVSYFSLLTGAAVIFDYLYQITFFAGCMAISGRREAASRHSILCCIKVKPQENATNCCGIYMSSEGSSTNNATSNDDASNGAVSNNVASTYVPVAPYNVSPNNGEYKSDALTNEENSEVFESPHPLMTFFRDYFSVFICKPIVKAVILVTYLSYIACAIWGVTCLTTGLAYQEMLPEHSFVTQFLDIESLYFKEYGFPVSVVINGEIDLLNSALQADLNNELAKFEDNEFTLSAEYSLSWLRSFQMFNNSILPQQGDPVDVLSFLRQPEYEDFRYDLVFDDMGERIVASRYYVSTTNIKHTSNEEDMMERFRDLAESSSYNITVFAPAFIFYDQYLKVLPTTIRSLGIALLAMMIVSLLLIPVPMCAVWVTMTILSIELGMIGFMALWGVHLDPVSMIVIIVCIGFSVDFPAHITYVFATSKGITPDDRVKDALYSLGMPVLQGAGSSILGVLVISNSDVYIFQAFFKTMFLVILLGAIHALVILPVMMSLFSTKPSRVSMIAKTSNVTPNEAYESNVDDDSEIVT